MFLLAHTMPENAEGLVKDAYSAFPEQVPTPEPMIMFSASPEMAKLQSDIVRYYINQETLDAELLSMLRYAVAEHVGYPYCSMFNAQLLQQAAGLTPEELKGLVEDPQNAPLEDEQKALFLFALHSVKNPGATDEADIQKLRDMGWSDQAVFDATYHAASMLTAGTLYKTFVK